VVQWFFVGQGRIYESVQPADSSMYSVRTSVYSFSPLTP
jgi:hypothetical protein